MSGASSASYQPVFVYPTYVNATPEQVWHALTDAELSARYWGHSNVSDWREGSRWEHRRTDGSGIADVAGTVLVSDRPHTLVTTWVFGHHESTVTFLIEPRGDIVRLTVRQTDLANEGEYLEALNGWSAVLSNLKSFLETGAPLPTEPWTPDSPD